MPEGSCVSEEIIFREGCDTELLGTENICEVDPATVQGDGRAAQMPPFLNKCVWESTELAAKGDTKYINTELR